MGTLIQSTVAAASLVLPDGIIVAAMVVINALGGLINPLTGELYATHGGFDVPLLYRQPDAEPDTVRSLTNTTLGVIATNVRLSKPQATKVAELAHDGLARAIRPIHAMLDGDSIFAVSIVTDAVVPANTTGAKLADMVGHAGADSIVLAVMDAARETQGVDDWPSVTDAQQAIRDGLR